MKKTAKIVRKDVDRGMAEIERLYSRMFMNGSARGEGRWGIHPEIKSRLHKKILMEIEALREAQRESEFGSQAYRVIDRKLRSRVLKEIQIIIDAYVVAAQGNRLEEWESMYGDIEHYKREFFYFRMDQDYETREKMLHDYKMIEKPSL
jgi:hypothetical protein